MSIEIYFNKELKYKKDLSKKTELNKIKVFLSDINKENNFVKEERSQIDKSDVDEITLENVLEENKLEINSNPKQIKKENELSDEKTNNKNNKKIIEIYLNNKLILNKKLNISDNIPTIRKILGEKIPEDCQFVFPNGLKMDNDDEEDYILEEIVINNKLNLFRNNNNDIKRINEKYKDSPINNERTLKTPDNCINVPLNGSNFIEESRGVKIYSYPKYDFSPEEQKLSKRIMFFGELGTGKTTLINSYINYLMKIKYNDNFRYKIIDDNFRWRQSDSQTKEVKEVINYNIRTLDGKLYQIIDTPGFGDTVGVLEEEKSKMKITDFLSHQINEINAICLVLKSGTIGLTHYQHYFFTSIFDLFGENTKDIFFAMITFCDGVKPQVLNSLTETSCLFSKIVKNRSNDWYFKFNNSAIFEKNVEDFFNFAFWNIGMDSFQKFTQKVENLPRISLDQTKEVINERCRLEILSKKLKEGLNQIETMKRYINMIFKIKGNFNDLRNISTKIEVKKTKKVPVTEEGKFMTTCLICTQTCHSGCSIKEDDDKFQCSCFKNDYCTVCKNKCHWSKHKNRPYEYVDYFEEETVTLEDLKKRYYDFKNKFDVKTQLLMGVKNDLIKIDLECEPTRQEIMTSFNRLKEIALNKTVFTNMEKNIDLLIEHEECQRYPGWSTRIQGLQVMKEQKKILGELSQGKFEDFEKIKKLIEDPAQNEENFKKFVKDMNDSTNGDNCLNF